MEDTKEEYYNWFQGGGFIIKPSRIGNMFDLFEVPTHGGEEQYVNTFSTSKDAKEHADTLT